MPFGAILRRSFFPIFSCEVFTNVKKNKNRRKTAVKKSYMRRQGTVAPKGEYSGKRNGSLTPKDYAQAKIYGEKAKQKYLDRKKRKKK